MPTQRLQEELQALRDQLERQPPLNTEERESLQALIKDIEMQMATEEALADETLTDSINLAVERFEASHPMLAGTLRSIMQSLANMGI
ncbi:DUF4404 family protein [Pseudomonas sp. ZM23]|uniref:DUF4404 family protein n=1 Tax=Pseudomonas triclosanedens TaxID=2961893 RepID=A0ABY6ZSQ3_9PSED|nr:DUF4404 family protein [Pseudomonas triclosanedens]MCP8467259.1 DUF4404 family protein [Pseudomonas triclosanedens]MCP8472586.1 DUF4404 family protein [Pseudomonas triclosanedens]MCP8478647.1 DUF4404 family protein [Pseudomonas triclosanedens]WAI47821.1 DUF4404 family protein [Pseudomonas triclosanedens]